MSTAADADLINQAGTDPVPSMSVPLSTEVQLLRGIGETLEDGKEVWHDTAYIRELNGGDEEALAALESKKGLTYTEYMNALLERSVSSIGDLNVATTPAVLNKLVLADRDMLFLGIVRATYGSERELRARCQACGEWNDIVIDLNDDFPIKQPDFDIRKPIEVPLSKGRSVYLRLPNGFDSIEAQKDAKTDAQLNTNMLARCAVFPDGEPEDRLEWARNLNVADRKKMVLALLDIEIGPSLEAVETQCDSCGADLPISLDWVSLLLS